MTERLSVAEASHDLPAAIERARRSDAGVVLTDAGKPVAKLLPIRPRGKTGREIAASGRLLPRLSPEEAEAFARDIEEGRKFFLPLRDPWA